MIDPGWVIAGTAIATLVGSACVQWGMNRSARSSQNRAIQDLATQVNALQGELAKLQGEASALRDLAAHMGVLEKAVTHMNTMVTTMAAQDPAVLQRLATLESEHVRMREKQHEMSTFMTALSTRTEERHAALIEKVGELRGIQRTAGGSGGGQP